jgi:hypothetical protein
MTLCKTKIVVFDLDETLGYFTELGMFWDALKSFIKYNHLKLTMDQTMFNHILDLYPEFLRPNIISILHYLKEKKQKNHCHKLMIYTNNQGPLEWANFIMKYFETKMNYAIFDQIIAAFKINGKCVELCRTTHMKTHDDLIKCTKIPKDAHICFLDDVFYPDMSNDKIYYINVKPYTHDLDFNEMITRFLNSQIIFISDPELCREFMMIFMKKYNYICVTKTDANQNMDTIISKKIVQHLHLFFQKQKTNTKKASKRGKRQGKSKGVTRKHKHLFTS